MTTEKTNWIYLERTRLVKIILSIVKKIPQRVYCFSHYEDPVTHEHIVRFKPHTPTQ